MGATDFTTVTWTDADMTAAYRAACDDAVQDCGYEPYNGTISTTSGVSRVLNGHTMTEQGAQTVAGWLNNGLAGNARGHKWEDAKAIAIASDDAFTFTTKTLRFSLDDMREYVESRVHELDGEWSRNYLRETLEERPSAMLWEFAAAKVPQAVALHTVHAVSTDFTPKFTLVTQRSSVPAATRYEVVGGRQNRGSHCRHSRTRQRLHPRSVDQRISPLHRAGSARGQGALRHAQRSLVTYLTQGYQRQGHHHGDRRHAARQDAFRCAQGLVVLRNREHLICGYRCLHSTVPFSHRSSCARLPQDVKRLAHVAWCC